MQRFDTRLFAALSVGFIIATIVGTLSHELGHFVVARNYGYHPRLAYNYTNFNVVKTAADSTAAGEATINGRYVWMLAAGPILTMLIGTIGLILLFVLRTPTKRAINPRTSEWILIFLSLFWLRPVANALNWTVQAVLFGKFSTRSDEMKIAGLLALPSWVFFFGSAAVGLAAVLVVILTFIPRSQRMTFFAALTVGGLLGGVLWMGIFGPMLLP